MFLTFLQPLWWNVYNWGCWNFRGDNFKGAEWAPTNFTDKIGNKAAAPRDVYRLTQAMSVVKTWWLLQPSVIFPNIMPFRDVKEHTVLSRTGWIFLIARESIYVKSTNGQVNSIGRISEASKWPHGGQKMQVLNFMKASPGLKNWTLRISKKSPNTWLWCQISKLWAVLAKQDSTFSLWIMISTPLE